MRFKKIAIVGLGLIGGSLAAAFKRKGLAVSIVGIDTEPVLAKGLRQGLIDEAYVLEEMAPGVAAADLIILAAPITGIVETIGRVREWVPPGVLITDVGSTKVRIVQAAQKLLPAGVYFLGGHPMAGAERGGVENADGFLFENAIYVLTEAQPLPRALKERFIELVERIGAKSVFLTAKAHDEIAAVVSHLPQLLAVTLMNFAAGHNQENSAYLKLAAGGFRDMTRVASSPFDIWRDILASNRENVLATIDRFLVALREMRDSLAEQRLEPVFVEAARNRLAIPKDTRGFVRPHFDLYVIVEDKPGVIAAIANALGPEGINIKDIEVVKVREGEGGTIRLAFETERERTNAMALLHKIGFYTQRRS